MVLSGIWLPIVTPFHNGEIDIRSYRNLIHHYLDTGISGFIPLGTTGESPCISAYEFESITEITLKESGHKLPIYIGVGGNDTQNVLAKLKTIEKYDSFFRGLLQKSK